MLYIGQGWQAVHHARIALVLANSNISQWREKRGNYHVSMDVCLNLQALDMCDKLLKNVSFPQGHYQNVKYLPTNVLFAILCILSRLL